MQTESLGLYVALGGSFVFSKFSSFIIEYILSQLVYNIFLFFPLNSCKNYSGFLIGWFQMVREKITF
jgi:hypothetical protein